MLLGAVPYLAGAWQHSTSVSDSPRLTGDIHVLRLSSQENQSVLCAMLATMQPTTAKLAHLEMKLEARRGSFHPVGSGGRGGYSITRTVHLHTREVRGVYNQPLQTEHPAHIKSQLGPL